MSKRILLTGSNGFIGRNIKESYLSKKYEIDTPSRAELNLIEDESVDEFFRSKEYDLVIHCACKPGHRNAKDRNNLFYSNIRMFENLQRHRDKYNKLINFGSGAIYDQNGDIVSAKEEDLLKKMPKDEHGFCKYMIYKEIKNLDNFIDLNIFGIFGYYEDYEIRFISNAICKAIFNLPITLRQNRIFSYIYIEDLIPILEYIIENKMNYKSYNIVPDEKTSLLDIAKTVKKVLGRDIEIKVAKAGFGLEYTGSNSLLKKEIKGLKFNKIEDSIKKLYNKYIENQNKIEKSLLLIDK